MNDELINRIVDSRSRNGWGGRKIRAVLINEGLQPAPAASTISEILKPEGCIGPYAGKMDNYKRFHRTLQQELTGKEMNYIRHESQQLFDDWRYQYNVVRPHEALQMNLPASRYQISVREYSEVIKPPEYDSLNIVRSVHAGGLIIYNGKDFKISKAYQGHKVALRPTERDGTLAIYFYHHKIGEIDIQN